MANYGLGLGFSKHRPMPMLLGTGLGPLKAHPDLDGPGGAWARLGPILIFK